jgi:hypothetical protein
MVLAAMLAVIFLLPPVQANAADDRPTVVELYTSQGCGSCVTADTYLHALSKRDDVIALTFPVTYWDYLGWKDTLARPEYDARQRAYATSAGSADIYTPQIIIDGVHREVGSQPDVIDELIAFQTGDRKPAVAINLWPGNKTIAVNVAAGALPAGAQSATIHLIQYDARQSVTIDKGENAGKQVSYSNVVRTITPVGVWQGEAMGLILPIRDFRRAGYSGIAVLLQVDDAGPILGAAKMDFSGLGD